MVDGSESVLVRKQLPDGDDPDALRFASERDDREGDLGRTFPLAHGLEIERPSRGRHPSEVTVAESDGFRMLHRPASGHSPQYLLARVEKVDGELLAAHELDHDVAHD